MITDSINAQIAQALKGKEEIRLSTLRMLSSALNYERIAKQHQLTEEEEIAVVRREIKKRNDAIEALKNAEGRAISTSVSIEDRIKKEQSETEVLKVYLPPEMDEAVLVKIIEEAIKTLSAVSQKDMGRVIGYVMGKVKGQVGGEVVSKIVKEKLTSTG